MDLVLLDGQGLEFVIVFGDWSGAFLGYVGALNVRFGALAPARTVAVRQLRYREESLAIAFRPLLAGHRSEQAQILTFDGNAATPWLEVADRAMSVQNERRRFFTAAGRLDRRNDPERSWDMVCDLYAFVAVTMAVDKCCSVRNGLAALREAERPETQANLVGDVWLIRRGKQHGHKGARWR